MIGYLAFPVYIYIIYTGICVCVWGSGVVTIVISTSFAVVSCGMY